MDEVLPDDPNEELDYVSVYPKIIRLQAFLYEVLRHFTPLVHVSKQARTPQTFQTSVGNFWIPGKTTIYINAIALHAEPSLWRGLNASPNEKLAIEDEWSFRPTRWINPPGSAQPFFQPPKGAYIAWSMGPRICPGQKMAQVEFVAIFLTIFRNRRIDAVPLENESRSQTEERLDKQMRNSISILTLIMEDVFDVEPDSGKGLHLALTKR